MNKNLVVYFSCSGVTKKVAENLAHICHGDLFEIRPKQAYTSADLNWNDPNSRSSIENNKRDIRPEIVDKINISEYKNIYLGFPIWWGVAPKIINTFLESYDFTGKMVIPFCTSGGSSMEYAENDLRKKYSNIQIKNGKRLSPYSREDEFISLIKG